jgi:competence protein ComEC
MGWIWVDVGREDVVLIKPEMMKKGTFTSFIEVSATKLWSGADSGLVLAMALGQKDALRTDFAKALKKAGVSHIAVASGFNVMLVASPILSLLLWFFKRRLATVVTLVGVWGYILLIGAGYSVVRAGLMISLYLTLLAVGICFNHISIITQ